MRTVALSASALVLLVAWACTDTPADPDADLLVVAPSFAHVDDAWPVPGHCYSTQTPVDYTDTDDPYPLLTTEAERDAAHDADANGNGWACLNLLNGEDLPPAGQRLDFDDDRASCTGDGYVAEFRGSAAGSADGNGNGFVCVSPDGTTVVDDATDLSQHGPGGDIGDPMPDQHCPAGAELIEVTAADHESYDTNLNGYICSTFGFLFSDDYGTLEPQGLSLTEGKVNGHGTYEVEGRTLSFSFHADSDGESVKGNFEFHDRTSGARIHGDVTCIEVDGGTALMEGVITLNKEVGPALGTAVAWTAVDNGEGKKAPDDEVSAPGAFGPWTEACAVRPDASTAPVSGGNVQVR